jgi:hypothetical protein
LAVVVLMLALTSCAVLIPKEHLIPKEKLVSTMHKQFPFHMEKAGGLFSITVDQPQLLFYPSQSRMGLNARFVAHAALFDIDGDFASSSMLRYDPKQRAVFLQDAKLDSFRIKQQGNRFTEMLRMEISRVLRDYAVNHPVYRFKPDELVALGMKIEVGNIAVSPEGVVLQLRPL